ncbi:hypothetical protein [Lysobacter sp. D1-1-M9]|uniref:hypothetical protein n=1 Tax=Novilysobacter longmucuonensis TaxID=3098603 RepID=UPI002FCCB500
MRMPTIAVTAAMLLALTGCPGPDTLRPDVAEATEHPDDPADGVWCGQSESSERVYVDIGYASDGMPSAQPDRCTVRPETHITWRAPVGGGPFEIRFSGETPSADLRTRNLSSAPIDSREKAEMTASERAGEYKYLIEANGKVLDPAIIIRN